MQLKILSNLKGRTEFLLLPFALYVYSLNYAGVIIFLVGLSVILYKREKTIILLAFLCMALYTAREFTYRDFYIEESITGTVTRVEKRSSCMMRVRTQGRYVLVFYEQCQTFKAGDIISVRGNRKDDYSVGMFGGFDYKTYLLSQGYAGVLYAEEVEKTDTSFNLYRLQGLIETRINTRLSSVSPYMHTFILANRSYFEQETLDTVSALGISHLFAVSGLHISFMVLMIYRGLMLLRVRENVRHGTLCIFLLLFMIITGFQASVMRASLMVIALIINKKLHLNFSAFDCLVLIFIGMLIINPYRRADIGFVLSFMVSFSLLLGQNYLQNESKIHQALTVSLLAFFMTIPIILGFNYKINIMSIPLNIVFVFYLTFLLLPLAYMAFFLPFLEGLLQRVITVFEWLVNMSDALFLLEVHAYILGGLWVVIYYSCVMVFLNIQGRFRVLKRGLIVVIVLIFVTTLSFVRPFQSLLVMDVYGDAIILDDAFNRCTLMIDTGVEDTHLSLVGAMKKEGIHSIDVLIITHEHFDHYGSETIIKDYFKVGQVIRQNNQTQFEGIMHVCGDINYYIFPLEQYHRSDNNRSLIVYVEFMALRYLFMGDAEVEREASFLAHYAFEVDVLKVGHHGSKTSTSDALLDTVKPREAIVTAYRYNTHNHPSPEVIDKLESRSITVHRTDLEGSMVFRKFYDIRWKKSALP